MVINIKLTLVSLPYVFILPSSVALHTKRRNFWLQQCWYFQYRRPSIPWFILTKCPLFGQNKITCLKCFRASFLPSFTVTRKGSAFFSSDYASSYSEKYAMNWVSVLNLVLALALINLISKFWLMIYFQIFFAVDWEQLLTVTLSSNFDAKKVKLLS